MGQIIIFKSGKKKLNSNNIFFLGFQNQDNCNFLRHKFDYLIAPYQKKVYVHGAVSENVDKKSKLETSKWMSPLKIFEYMGSGRAIISSDIAVLHEVLVNEFNCLVVKPDDLKSWLNAFLKLQNDDTLLYKISKNARKDFLKNYTWSKRVKNILTCA